MQANRDAFFLEVFSYDDNPTYSLDFTFDRSFANLAVQHGLGILPERGVRTNPLDCDCSRAHGAPMT